MPAVLNQVLMGGRTEWRRSDEAELVFAVGPNGVLFSNRDLDAQVHSTHEQACLASDTGEPDDWDVQRRGRHSKLKGRAEEGLTDRGFRKENRQGRRIY